jgi:hypothetical protein
MKKALVILLSVLASLPALAQQVNFSNKDSAKNINAPIYDVAVGGTKLDGAAYFAQLFGGAAGTVEGSLVALGEPVNFRTGTAAGYIAANTVTIPGVGFGASAVVQMRAWSANGGATWAAASAAADANALVHIGKSALLNVTMPASAVDPNVPGLVGLTSFEIKSVGGTVIVPEPSTMALCLLGAAALLIRRRK